MCERWSSYPEESTESGMSAHAIRVLFEPLTRSHRHGVITFEELRQAELYLPAALFILDAAKIGSALGGSLQPPGSNSIRCGPPAVEVTHLGRPLPATRLLRERRGSVKADSASSRAQPSES